jgi:hypothetical protein
VKRLTDFERGLVMGLFIGEASFTGDGDEPWVAVKMHVRHEHLLRWLRDLFPGSELYGPYKCEGNRGDQMTWRARWRCLRDEVMPELRGLERYCPHVASRIEKLQNEYPSRFWRETGRFE